MRAHLTILIVLIAMVSCVAAPQPAQTAGAAAPEKREHTVYILDMGFSSNEQGFGTLILVLDALPGNTNIIRVVNKSKSPHGFQMQIKNRLNQGSCPRLCRELEACTDTHESN